MANVWMHNGFLQVEGEKMAKSLGNFFTVADLRSEMPPELIRAMMLSAHYTQPLDWTEDLKGSTYARLMRWHEAAFNQMPAAEPTPEFLAAICDDLNTPQALKVVDDLYKASKYAEMRACLGLLGLVDGEIGQWARSVFQINNFHQRLRKILELRDVAKSERDYAKADGIRDRLKCMGINVLDSKMGATYELDYIGFSSAMRNFSSLVQDEDPESLMRLRELGWSVFTNSEGKASIKTSVDIFGAGMQRLLSYVLWDLVQENLT
jgi:cysteinyl-tRNA synthetase